MIPVTHRGCGVVSGVFFGGGGGTEEEREDAVGDVIMSLETDRSPGQECPHLFNLTLTADTTKCHHQHPRKLASIHCGCI